MLFTRYNIEINQRICKQCDQYKIEDEFHLIFECPKYSELRINAFSTKNEDINLAHDSNVENLQYFFSQASLYSFIENICIYICIYVIYVVW